MRNKLTIYEENTSLMWAPVIVVSAALGTYLLGDILLTEFGGSGTFRHLLVFGLFLLSIYGIVQISEPLYKFVFTTDDYDRVLVIRIFKGEHRSGDLRIPFSEIEALKFSSIFPRERGEALFDLSGNYRLLYRKKGERDYRPLLQPGTDSFVLKPDDISKVIRFIRSYNPGIYVPEEQANFFDV